SFAQGEAGGSGVAGRSDTCAETGTARAITSLAAKATERSGCRVPASRENANGQGAGARAGPV
ncbi:MAG: hypothetical protein ACK59R_08945, partial [Pseudomonadota bacterium]